MNFITGTRLSVSCLPQPHALLAGPPSMQPAGSFERIFSSLSASTSARDFRRSLLEGANTAAQSAIAPATARRYERAVQLYMDMCQRCDLWHPLHGFFFPPSSETLLLYASFASRQGKEAQAIKVDLTAIRRRALFTNLEDPYTAAGNVPAVVAATILGNQRALAGSRHALGIIPKRLIRIAPTTAQILCLLDQAPLSLVSPLRVACFVAVVISVFMNAFRAGDILPATSSSYSPILHLRYSDVTVTDTADLAGSKSIVYFLRATKTDRWRKGILVNSIDQPGRMSVLGAYNAWVHQRAVLPTAGLSNAMFVKPDGRPYSVQTFRDELRMISVAASLPPGITPHAFRGGASSSLHAAGVPESAIQAHGRWAPNSSAYKAYIKPSVTIRNSRFATLAST